MVTIICITVLLGLPVYLMILHVLGFREVWTQWQLADKYKLVSSGWTLPLTMTLAFLLEVCGFPDCISKLLMWLPLFSPFWSAAQRAGADWIAFTDGPLLAPAVGASGYLRRWLKALVYFLHLVLLAVCRSFTLIWAPLLLATISYIAIFKTMSATPMMRAALSISAVVNAPDTIANARKLALLRSFLAAVYAHVKGHIVFSPKVPPPRHGPY